MTGDCHHHCYLPEAATHHKERNGCYWLCSKEEKKKKVKSLGQMLNIASSLKSVLL